MRRPTRLGGHSHTVEVEERRGSHWIDTGFIVFNDRNYPNFERLLEELEVPSQPSHMGFSVSDGARRLRVLGHAARHLRPPGPPAQPRLPRHAARLAPLQPRGAGADRDERHRALARPLAGGTRLLPPLHRAPDRPPGLRGLVGRPGADVELPGQLHGRVLRQPRHVQPARPAALAHRAGRLAQLRRGDHRPLARPHPPAGAGAQHRAARRTACGSPPTAARARTSTRS